MSEPGYFVHPSSIVEEGAVIGLSRLINVDRQQRKHILLRTVSVALLIIGVVIIIYFIFLYRLPSYVIEEDLNYLRVAQFHLIPSALGELGRIFLNHWTASWPSLFIGVLVLMAWVRIYFIFKKGVLTIEEKGKLRFILASLFIFILFNLNEFLVSAVWFRYIWVFPLTILMLFTSLYIGFAGIRPRLQMLLTLAFLIAPLFAVYDYHSFVAYAKRSENLLHIGNNKVYLSPVQQPWIQTVSQVTNFIIENVPEKDKLICIAYCPLYNFLSSRDSPTPDLSLPGGGKREEQNLNLIKKAEVPYILLENRAIRSPEWPDSIFSKTFGLKLSKYLYENYQLIKTIGPFESPAGWIHNHAIQIYKKSPPHSSNNFKDGNIPSHGNIQGEVEDTR